MMISIFSGQKPYPFAVSGRIGSLEKNMKSDRQEYSFKNIRATASKEFWGTEFAASIYLWDGAKHNLTLREIGKIEVPTFDDLFSTAEEITYAHEYCKKIYFKFVSHLTLKLNEIHDLDLPESFWRLVFGYWLFRHICIVYEKYSYLSKVNIDKTSIKLLNKQSFYIPRDHYDYVSCFCTDFGVQQLVSQYYYLFANKKFSCISEEFSLEKNQKKISLKGALYLVIKSIKKTFKYFVKEKVDPEIIICGAYYTSKVLKSLYGRSKGRIQPFSLPKVCRSNNQIDETKRQKIIDIKPENDFERFLIKTFYYCFPRILIEQFLDYYKCFLDDIRKKHFKYIVSEEWISNIPNAIYLAISKQRGGKIICQEHAACGPFLKDNLMWIEHSVADLYLTTGWKRSKSNIIPGGFSCRDINVYQFSPEKKNILFISHVRFPYLIEFGGNNETNSNYMRSLRIVNDFIDLLPHKLRNNFIFRPRKGIHLWDTEYAWELKKRSVRVDRGDFSKSILQARVVVIDHLSTGAAEILLTKVPFLIILDDRCTFLNEEYNKLFDSLVSCGIVHKDSQSAIKHLIDNYADIEKWWHNRFVQEVVNQFISEFLSDPSNTVDYLISCLKENKE